MNKTFSPRISSGLVGLVVSAFLLPATAFAHQGESDAPWIDFSQFGFDGMSKMFNTHPAFVHFPITLIPTMLLFYCMGIWLKNHALLLAGRATLYLAFLSLLVVIYTGMAARSTPSNDAIEKIMGTHKNLGWVILGLSAVLTAWSFWTKSPGTDTGSLSAGSPRLPRASWAFLFTAALATFLIFQNADLGGRMVYLHGAAVKPVVEDFRLPGGGHAQPQ